MRRIKSFWEDFSHNRIGMIGLTILAVYIAVAFLTPVLITNDPEKDVADAYALPSWMAIINPDLQKLPRNATRYINWINQTTLPSGVTVNRTGTEVLISFAGEDEVTIQLWETFNYPYVPPSGFRISFSWEVETTGAEYSLEIKLTTPNQTTLPVWDQHWGKYHTHACMLRNPNPPPINYPGSPEYDRYSLTGKPSYMVYEELYGGRIPTWDTDESVAETVTSADLTGRLGFKRWEDLNVTNTLLSPPGDFTFHLYVVIKPTTPDSTCQISMRNFTLYIKDQLFGLLGTTHFCKDVWSRLILGVRISLAVGLTAALVSTSIGVLVGVAAGYLGGATDEALMRLVDILICIPALPILMVLVVLFGRNVWYIVIIIAIFGWLGISRVIRSQVLSIREMPFIECATASGASKPYIMLRHIVPNVMPVALTDLVLSIPGAILLEAGLSFIGFGDPTSPTWGREFNLAYHVGGAFKRPDFAWWWTVPPGIAITLLCVAFVFISHALDEVINPRLRRRR